MADLVKTLTSEEFHDFATQLRKAKFTFSARNPTNFDIKHSVLAKDVVFGSINYSYRGFGQFTVSLVQEEAVGEFNHTHYHRLLEIYQRFDLLPN